jgi:photosynthetic reaction center cytochrome c subunit
MSRRTISGAGVRNSLFLAASAAVLLAQATPVPTPNKKASEVFKNIQVLKDVPADQLIPAMQFMTSALGVQCEFCHVENAFDKDDKKPKPIARKMMGMEFAIDSNNFDGKQMVTCYSCHRGSPRPLAIPIIPESQPRLISEAEPPNQPSAPDLPKAEEMVAKYVAGLGGEVQISKLTSLDEKGTFEAGGHQFPVEIFVESPNKIATVTEWPNGESRTILDEQSGWIVFPQREPRPMTPADVDGSRMDANLRFSLDLNKIFSPLKTEKATQIDGHDVVMVSGERPGMPPVEMYFDRQSGLLVRMVRYGDSPLGRNPIQIDYSDYREVSGVKRPFRWVSATPTGRFIIQIESAQANRAIAESRFEGPSQTH